MEDWESSIEQFLEQKGYAWERNDGLICFTIQGALERYPVFVMARKDMLVTLAQYPSAVPDEKCLEMAHFLHMANFGMLLGNFEIDLDEGELRFKTCLYLPGQKPARACLARYLFTPALMLEKYAPGVRAILDGRALAGRALALCEDA
ncbi:MAG: YbjN domain-containing protein [Christensenellaceae bacterium]|jgi:hypothetical protein|nr:YbjN domain-containing protein [Christensenellaceae bacterium]